MSQDSKNLTTQEVEAILDAARPFGDLLIRLGRSYLKCLSAPNRSENEDAEERFTDALGQLTVAIIAAIQSQSNK